MKLPKELTTVSRLSKTLALILFVALPFTGFYYGRVYQQSVDSYLEPKQLMKLPEGVSKPETTASLNIDEWKEFKDPGGKFSINFPQNWLISFKQSDYYKDKMDLKLEGPEGQVDILWADSYGGACKDPGYEKMQIKSGQETVCHARHIEGEGIAVNAEFWQLQKQFTKNQPLGIYLNAYSFNKNRDVILNIIKSLDITTK